MWVQKVVLRHQTDTTGVKMFIRHHLLYTCNLFHKSQDPRILKCVNNLLEYRGIFIHLSGNIFILTKALLQHHHILVGKRPEYLLNLCFGQKIVDDTTMNGMLMEFISEPSNFGFELLCNDLGVFITIHVLTSIK